MRRKFIIDSIMFVLAAMIVIVVLLVASTSANAEGGFTVTAGTVSGTNTSGGGYTITYENPWYPPKPQPKPKPKVQALADVDQRPIVYRLTASWCGPCQALSAYLTKAVRDKLPFQIIDWNVDTQGWMGASSIPAFWWKAPRGNLRCPWSNVENLVATWKASQAPVVKAGAKSDAQAAADNYQPGWTWPGDLRQHLHATHGIGEASQLTQDQAEQLHDALHQGYSAEQIRRYAIKRNLIQK
ncbi:MAG: hypothetical protein V4719_10730 [Planctomycetota bacterium]